MNLKLPIGFDFKQYQTTQQLIDSQVSKYLKTWKCQRIYRRDYGVEWSKLDNQKANDDRDKTLKIQEFLSRQLRTGLPQIKVISVQLQSKNDPNSLSFYLVYNYKGIFQSRVLIEVNMDGQVDVQINSGKL